MSFAESYPSLWGWGVPGAGTHSSMVALAATGNDTVLFGPLRENS